MRGQRKSDSQTPYEDTLKGPVYSDGTRLLGPNPGARSGERAQWWAPGVQAQPEEATRAFTFVGHHLQERQQGLAAMCVGQRQSSPWLLKLALGMWDAISLVGEELEIVQDTD